MTVIKPNAIAGINSITVASGAALAVHKADGTLIQTIAGTSGVSTFSSVSVGSATTTNDAAKSINIGLGASIAQHNDNTLTFGTNGDPRITIDASGNLNVGSAATIAANGNVTAGIVTATEFVVGAAVTIGRTNGNATFAGIVTATAFKGDGSGLSGVTAVTINNNANNRVITGSGSANTLEAESNMTFTGSILTVTNSSGASELTLVTPSANDSGVYFNDGSNAGAVTYNHSDDSMRFRVGSQERLRITGVGGSVGINEDAPLYELVVSPVDSNESQIQILAGGNGKESNVLFGAPDDADVGSIKYDHNGDQMKFTVGTSEIFRANSHGICLGGTGSANGLNDYEEGTFTPTARGNNTNSSPVIEGSGKYTKIGNVVQIQLSFANENGSYLPSGEYIQIHGLPFTFSGEHFIPYGFNYKVVFNSTDQYLFYSPSGNTRLDGYINRSDLPYTPWGTDQWDNTQWYHSNSFSYLTS